MLKRVSDREAYCRGGGKRGNKSYVVCGRLAMWGEDKVEVQRQVDVWSQEVEKVWMKVSAEETKQ